MANWIERKMQEESRVNTHKILERATVSAINKRFRREK
jgi:hypothetical protein